MQTVLMILHVLVCFVLILVVLLQRGKGSDIGAALGGGGSNTVFGGRGAGNFLTKMTTGAAITFMLTSLSLAYLSNKEHDLLIFDDEVIEESTDEPSAGALEEIDIDATGEQAGEQDASADELVEIDPSEDDAGM